MKIRVIRQLEVKRGQRTSLYVVGSGGVVGKPMGKETK